MDARTPTPIFISGTPGSGTTALVRVLSSLKGTVAAVGRYRTVPHSLPALYAASESMHDATQQMWERAADYGQYLKAKDAFAAAAAVFASHEEAQAITHVIMKRSSPFQERDRCRPDLLDVLDVFPQARFIISYRDPREAAYTIYRWFYALNLRNAAVLTEEGLTTLAAQWKQIPAAQRMVIDYARFIETPRDVLARVAAFVGLDAESLAAASDQESLDDYADDPWRDGLHEQEISFLNTYFDQRRLNQWRVLIDALQDTQP